MSPSEWSRDVGVSGERGEWLEPGAVTNVEFSEVEIEIKHLCQPRRLERSSLSLSSFQCLPSRSSDILWSIGPSLTREQQRRWKGIMREQKRKKAGNIRRILAILTGPKSRIRSRILGWRSTCVRTWNRQTVNQAFRRYQDVLDGRGHLCAGEVQ